MARNKSNSPVRVADELKQAELQKRIWNMTLAGATVRDIAEAIGISRQWVCDLRKKMLTEIKQEGIELAQEFIDLELERLDQLLRTHWVSANRTRKVVDKATDEEVFVPSRDSIKHTEIVLKIMQQRSKLLGLETEKIEHSGGIQIQWTDPVTKDDDIGYGADELDK